MEKKENPKCPSSEVDNNPEDEFQALLQTLEQQTNWDGQRLVKYNGFWLLELLFRPILSARKYFKAKATDVILSTMPKSGTTWLKALTFSIANRSVFPIDQSPLLTSNPHKVVPALEFNLYWGKENPDPELIPDPRILSTHIPFEMLPDSIRESDCRIIYVSRNPLDVFISHRHFLLENKFAKDAVPLALDEAFDMFCQGIHPFGPFWDHMLGYWNAHLKNPERVLFLKYEDLKEDILSNVKKIAEFIGSPFSPEEEKQGVVEQISRLCSFENLKNLEVNKSGNVLGLMKNSSFFRKGEVGDCVNFLTPEMAERIKNLMEREFQGSGLIYNI
ncbi:Cytosolic sulfotransferase 15 [Sesamum alatum]|uniref:Sulfotransferase n=1 Tax=Sesamum alatum TaxID=300844 RepID=A0AAE1Y2D5_9LAMI|nr:Cytosolic sulfotransferase 15 [Sesamum alatum]